MAAPTPPNYETTNGLDSSFKTKPPEGVNITYPKDLSSIKSTNGSPYAISISAYNYRTSNTLRADFNNSTLNGITGGLVSAFDFTGLTGLLNNIINNNIREFGSTPSNENVLGQNLGTVNLQLPVKINDVQTLTWSQESAKAIFDFFNLIRLQDVIRSTGGTLVNPALFMMFHHPNFKTIDMTWQFAAHNEQESYAIANIINFFKYFSSPKRKSGTGFVMDYPSMFIIKLYPDDQFTFRIKPCIIENVVTDFTPANYPSFNKNGSPVAINLAVRFKEIEIWSKDTWEESGTGVS